MAWPSQQAPLYGRCRDETHQCVARHCVQRSEEVVQQLMETVSNDGDGIHFKRLHESHKVAQAIHGAKGGANKKEATPAFSVGLQVVHVCFRFDFQGWCPGLPASLKMALALLCREKQPGLPCFDRMPDLFGMLPGRAPAFLH